MHLNNLLIMHSINSSSNSPATFWGLYLTILWYSVGHGAVMVSRGGAMRVCCHGAVKEFEGLLPWCYVLYKNVDVQDIT